MTLEELEKSCNECTMCELCSTRNNVVFGQGNNNAKLMLIGEAPGKDEDLTGNVFVGKSGQLLTKMLNSIDVKREDIYIANIVKCRPPYNRDPKPKEREECIQYLRRQVSLINPKLIVCLGRVAAITLMDKNLKITKEHGKLMKKGKFLMMATYHPSALLRDPSKKIDAWKDLKKLKKQLDEIN